METAMFAETLEKPSTFYSTYPRKRNDTVNSSRSVVLSVRSICGTTRRADLALWLPYLPSTEILHVRFQGHSRASGRVAFGHCGLHNQGCTLKMTTARKKQWCGEDQYEAHVTWNELGFELRIMVQGHQLAAQSKPGNMSSFCRQPVLAQL